MLKYIKSLFKKKPRLYPVVDPKNVKYIPKETPIETIVGLWVILMCAVAYCGSCSPKGTLNCGSKYKLIAPKFKK